MSVITVSMAKAPGNATNARTNMTFSARGGTIGRSSDNAWVLDDPDRFISGRHVQIDCLSNRFYLTDLSTNGTFLNGASEPVGRGCKTVLSDGDVFTLGDYEFTVSVSANAAVSEPLHEEPAKHQVSGPFSGLDIKPQRDIDPLAFIPDQADPLWEREALERPLLPVIPEMPGSVTEQSDPLALLGGSESELFADPPEWDGVVSYSDGAGAVNQAYSFPSAIPEDWDDDFSDAVISNSQPIVPPPVRKPDTPDVDFERVRQLEQTIKALEKANGALELRLRQLQEQVTSASVKVDLTGGHVSLIRALGLDQRGLSDEKVAMINQVAGDFIRVTIAGMMQAVSYKNSIKNEFRMNVTTIQPVENNPLNFSANIEDAIENMFVKEGNAYKKPVDAIREGFQSIGDHQVAVLAGIRAGFNRGLERFDPEVLEMRFNKYLKSGLIQVSKKARHWDSYRDYYNELVNDMDASFKDLFGDDFVNAYEDQLQKLSLNRSKGSK